MPELILNRLSNFFFFLVIKKFTPEESSFKLQESSFLAKGWRDYLGPPDRNVNQPEVLFKSIAWDIIYFSIKKKKCKIAISQAYLTWDETEMYYLLKIYEAPGTLHDLPE